MPSVGIGRGFEMARLTAIPTSGGSDARELDALRCKRSEAQLQSTNLEGQLRILSRLLRDREQTIDKQEELLGHDRDIRDLM